MGFLTRQLFDQLAVAPIHHPTPDFWEVGWIQQLIVQVYNGYY